MAADGTVIGLLKKKTAWYIILRAIREKSKQAVNPRRSAGLPHHRVSQSYSVDLQTDPLHASLHSYLMLAADEENQTDSIVAKPR